MQKNKSGVTIKIFSSGASMQTEWFYNMIYNIYLKHHNTENAVKWRIFSPICSAHLGWSLKLFCSSLTERWQQTVQNTQWGAVIQGRLTAVTVRAQGGPAWKHSSYNCFKTTTLGELFVPISIQLSCHIYHWFKFRRALHYLIGNVLSVNARVKR